MIRILDLNRSTTAILENAYAIGYEKQVNAIWQASFSLPINDPKVKKVELLKYVEITDGDEYIGLFRIIPKHTSKSGSAGSVTYKCEHVLATLLNSILFKYHQLSNYQTDKVLQYLINQQREKHWRLGIVEIIRGFHYSWENENLISSIFSVPKPFDEPHMWDFDTQGYPWTLDLIRPEISPTCRIKEGYNLIGLEIEENPMSVYNRIYPLGVGEGVNQLGIEDVNNGIPYIEDKESIAKNGVIETIWSDKRFTDAASLKASAAALLKKWKEPIFTWKASAADVSKITGLSIDELKVGRVVRLQLDDYPVTDLRIMKESKNDITGSPGNVQLEIGNVTADLGTTQADMQRRQQVNELYSMGATNLDSYTFNDNADPDFPAIIEFPFPDDMVNVNESKLRIKTSPFRGYTRGAKAGGFFEKGSTVQSKSTAGGGGQTTSGGGGQTTSSGGGQTTSSGGGQTSSGGGDHKHVMFTPSDIQGPFVSRTFAASSGHVVLEANQSTLTTAGSSGNHSHTVSNHIHTVSNHTHTVSSHTHKVDDHTHDFAVTIPSIEIPSHSHEQIYGIYEHASTPSKLTVKIDGQVVSFSGTEGEIDITDHLRKDSNGKVTRDYHTIEVSPNDLARISMIVTNRFFIQSHLGGVF